MQIELYKDLKSKSAFQKVRAPIWKENEVNRQNIPFLLNYHNALLVVPKKFFKNLKVNNSGTDEFRKKFLNNWRWNSKKANQ